MKKIAIISGIIVFVSLLFVIPSFHLTGKIIEQDLYGYAVAICSNGQCEDYQIECKGNNLITITPTSQTIKISENWKDIRRNTNLCN